MKADTQPTGMSTEQRKVRSRDAARCRRSQETEVFYELAHSLPLPRRVASHLDKAAIMRVALSYLRMRHILATGDAPAEVHSNMEEEMELEEKAMDELYQHVLDGFIMVLSEDGDIVFLSESVNKYLGITQLELLGQSAFDFVHACDQEELRDILTARPVSFKKGHGDRHTERNFFLRMKSTLTNRGRTVNIKSATWKVLHCTGHMQTFRGEGEGAPPPGNYLTLLCEPIPHPSSVEFPLDGSTFVTRHNMDLTFTQCDGRVTELVGYEPEEMLGRSFFEYFHALDFEHVTKSFHTLLSKGQVCTKHYRFLARRGGYVWVETKATVIYNSRTSQPEAIVCLHFILSGVEQADVVFSAEQTRPVLPLATKVKMEQNSSLGELYQCLKNNPEELVKLAPTAGDTVLLLKGEVDLSFSRPESPEELPNFPKQLCSPELRQLLSPIFDEPSSPAPRLSPVNDMPMETGDVESFFATKPDVPSVPTFTKIVDDMDLDMLAPYISMDDDFQLTSLAHFTDADSSLSPPRSPLATPRKRPLEADDDMVPSWQKRLKKSTIEDELLLTHSLLDSLMDSDGSDELELLSRQQSKLLTDRDPLLGSTPGLCDSMAL